MKFWKTLSIIILTVLLFSSSSVFAQNNPSNSKNTGLKDQVEIILTDDDTGKEIKLKTLECFDPKPVMNLALYSNSEEIQYKQTVVAKVPVLNTLRDASGTVTDSAADQTYSVKVYLTIYYSEKETPSNIGDAVSNISRRIDKVNVKYNVTDKSTWFYYADVSYVANGIKILDNNNHTIINNEYETMQLIDAMYTCDRDLVASKTDLWIYVNDEIGRSHFAGFYGKLSNQRGGSWSMTFKVNVP